MAQTNQEKLDEMYEMVQENNDILRTLLRRERINSFLRIMYWLFIIGTLFGAYYYVQPFVNGALGNFGAIQSAVNNLNVVSAQLPESKTLQFILDFLGYFKK